MIATVQTQPETLVEILNHKMQAHLASIEQSEAYQLLSASDADPRLATTIVKYILLEVFSYGPHVTEATFTAIGRLPKNRPDLMIPMIRHDLSEVDHGEMALRDFIKLGGSETWARSRRITPASYALSATCRMLTERENPFSYLGYMYLINMEPLEGYSRLALGLGLRYINKFLWLEFRNDPFSSEI